MFDIKFSSKILILILILKKVSEKKRNFISKIQNQNLKSEIQNSKFSYHKSLKGFISQNRECELNEDKYESTDRTSG